MTVTLTTLSLITLAHGGWSLFQSVAAFADLIGANPPHMLPAVKALALHARDASLAAVQFMTAAAFLVYLWT